MGVQNALMSQVQELLDVEAIRKLHVTYSFSVDEHRWRDAGELFTHDAIADWGPTRAKVTGRREIVTYFETSVAPVSVLTRHMMTQARIHVVGDTARCECYMFGCGTKATADGQRPVWTLGRYNNTCVRDSEGIWRFHRLNFEFTFQTPFESGWVKQPDFIATT